MLERCLSAATVESLRAGPAGPFLDGFAAALLAEGYAPTTSAAYAHTADHLCRWLSQQRRTVEQLDDVQLRRFFHHLPTCQCDGRTRHARKGVLYRARRVLQYLRETGVVTRGAPQATWGPVVSEYVAWLRDRGLAAATIRRAGGLVEALLDTVTADPTQLAAAGVRGFVLAYIRDHAPASAGSVTSMVRGFLRWLVMCNRCPTDLTEAVPKVPTWALARLPQYLPDGDVERVIAACDRQSEVAWRDRAMLLLLARVGLRAGDVVGLRLPDVDWTHGRVRVAGKSRRATRLPLPQDAGDALLHYLEVERPVAATDRVFLTARPPLRAISASGLRDVVRRAMERAGVPAPSHGTHILRHSLATRLLRDGATLDTIGALLRHRDVNTTAIYAKVDVDRLRHVAQPWPDAEVSSC